MFSRDFWNKALATKIMFWNKLKFKDSIGGEQLLYLKNTDLIIFASHLGSKLCKKKTSNMVKRENLATLSAKTGNSVSLI